MPETLTAKQIREQELGPIYAEMCKMRDSINDPQNPDKKSFTAEEEERWNKLDTQYASAKRRAEVVERAEEIGTYLAKPRDTVIVPGREDYNGRAASKAHEEEVDAAREGRPSREDTPGREQRGQVTDEDKCLALQAWFRNYADLDVSDQQKRACKKLGVNYRGRQYRLGYSRVPYHKIRQSWRKGDMETRALSALQLALGGATVPEGFVQNLEEALLQFGGIRQVADVLRTASGNDLPWPTVNDTTNKGAILSENATVTAQDVSMGQIVFHAFKYTSKLVLVPVELLEDSAFDLAAELGRLLGIRIGRILSDHFTTGTGASQPNGIVTAATSGATGGSTSAILSDDIYALKHSVDPAYRMGSGVGWMMHDQILMVIKKLKDGLGRPLWQASLAGRAPDTLDGDPIYINQSMVQTVGSGNKTVLYGDLSKYKIRDVSEFRLRRLIERYADADQVGFIAFSRHDGNLLDAGTHPVKYLTH